MPGKYKTTRYPSRSTRTPEVFLDEQGWTGKNTTLPGLSSDGEDAISSPVLTATNMSTSLSRHTPSSSLSDDSVASVPSAPFPVSRFIRQAWEPVDDSSSEDNDALSVYDPDRDSADRVFQGHRPGSSDAPPSDEGGARAAAKMAGNDTDSLLAFIDEARLEEAREFRRKGYNSQVPEVDPGLLTQLHDTLAAAKHRLLLQKNVEGPLGSLWLQGQIWEIDHLTENLSDDCIKNWVEHEMPHKSHQNAEMFFLGRRRAAQSLARRLESTLQTLIRVVDILCLIDTCGTPEKRCDILVAELTGVFSPGEKNSVIQALDRIKEDAEGHAAWSSLVQSRDAAWVADSTATFGAMSQTTRHEAEKTGKKARQLQGASHAFFKAINAYIHVLSRDLTAASVNASKGIPKGNEQATPLSYSDRILNKLEAFFVRNPLIFHDIPVYSWPPSGDLTSASDKQVTPLSRSDSLLDKLETGLVKNKLKADIAIAMGKTQIHRLNRVRVHGHPSGTLSKTSAQVTNDSVIRSILWQWQQPAIKIQYASGALLSKVDELQEIKGMFSSSAVAQDEGRKPEDSNTPVSAPVADDRVAQVRQWVNERAEQAKEQAKPETQQAEKLAVLEKLLDGDIDNARALTERLRKEAGNIENLLRKQRFAVLKMVIQRSGLAPSLKKVDTLLPKVASDLTAACVALDKACQAATTRDFADAKKQVSTAQLLATKIKEKLSTKSAWLTERPLDEHSRSSRLAIHWANIARDHHLSVSSSPDAVQVLFSLKKLGGLEEILSSGDPEGYLFATRLAGELDNARHDELRLPMSPEQYAALEKGIVEYIVKWGQKRISRAGTRLIIELAFEHGLDTVSFSLSSLFRLPYKVLKASIKVPYSVNKINNYIMPGNDKPYKAINNLLGKKLKQLGFNLMTAPLPGIVKLAGGGLVAAGAAAHNVYFDRKENTFSTVYGRVAEGDKSQKIKMDSAAGMIFDSAIDGTTTTAFKGARRTWKSGKPLINAYSDDLSEDALWQAQSDEEEISDDSDEGTLLQKQWAQAATGRDVGAVNPASRLPQQAGVKPFGDSRDPTSSLPPIRRKRALEERKTAQSPQHVPTGVNYDSRKTYHELSEETKKQTYSYAIIDTLDKIAKDESLPGYIRTDAHEARIGFNKLVPVYLSDSKLNNVLFLPDRNIPNAGILIRLNAEVPYSYVIGGRNIPDDLKNDMPHNSDKESIYPYGPSYEISPSRFEIFEDIKNGKKDYNFDTQKPMSISDISADLVNTIETDYRRRGIEPENKLMMSRAVNGAQLPAPDVTVSAVPVRINYTWGGATPEEYLRSLEKPFTTFAGQVQLMLSANAGDTIQEADEKKRDAEYIGSWIDATAGVFASVTPAGIVFSSVQTAASIIADLAEGKDPDPLAVAGLVVGCIPGGQISARIGKLSKTGAKIFTYSLAVGNKIIDLGILTNSIKIAVETGEPLAIYQALLASGMSAKNSFDMTKNISVHLKLGNKIEDSASLEELEAIQNSSVSPDMPVRILKVGKTQLHGKINNGKIKISRDGGVTWEEGNDLHLLMYRLQNAGGKLTLPKEDEPSHTVEGPENPTGGQYEPHTPGYQKDYSIELKGFRTLKSRLKQSKASTRVQKFNHETSSYYNVDDYEVVPYQTTILDGETLLDDTVVRQALVEMQRKYKLLKGIATDYTGSHSADLQENLKTGESLVSELLRELPDSPSSTTMYFLLVEKTEGPVSPDNILGISKIVDLPAGAQPGEKGSIFLQSVVAHPYTLISKNDSFLKHAATKGVNLSQENRTRYNIKRVSSQLMRDGLKKTIKKIETEVKDQGRTSKPNSIKFSSRNPITARMAKKFGARRIGEEIKFINLQKPKAAPKIITRDSPGVIAEPLNLDITDLVPLTDTQQQAIDTTRKLLEGDSTIRQYIAKPVENCANAAKKVTEILTQKGYTNIRFAELGIWRSDYSTPDNHFVVFANYNGVDIAVDITAGQFRRGEMQGPIYTTTSNWKLIVKGAFGQGTRQPNLVKYKEFPVSFNINTHATMVTDLFGPNKNPFETIEGGEILARPRWHARVFDTMPLREKSYRHFDNVIEHTLSKPNGTSSAESPWEFVLQLQFDAGLLNTRTEERLLQKSKSWSQSNNKKFFNSEPRRVSSMEQLSKLPKGSRIQLTVVSTGSKHPMLSLGGGEAISVDNTWMGPDYGAGIQKISLLNDFENPLANIFTLKGARGDVEIHVEQESRLPTIESLSRTEEVSSLGRVPPRNPTTERMEESVASRGTGAETDENNMRGRKSEASRKNVQLAQLKGQGPFELEGSPDDVPFDYQVYRYDDIGTGVHMPVPENIATGGAQCDAFLLRGTGEGFLTPTGKQLLGPNVRVLNVVNGDAGTVAVKIPLSRVTEENPLLAWSGDLSGCTVVYAVKGDYFYVYHAGLRSNAEGLPVGWSTGVEGVNSIAKSHTALGGGDVSELPHENNSLVDIFSSYDSAVIVYMGKEGRLITQTAPGVHTFNYAEIPMKPFTSRVASSQVLLTRVGDNVKLECLSEDIFNPTVPEKSMAEVKRDFRVLKSQTVDMGSFEVLSH